MNNQTYFAKSTSLSRRHWRKGGTGIVNFESRLIPVYQEAIALSNNQDKLCISLAPIEDTTGFGENPVSLHYTTIASCYRELTSFWTIFESVRYRYEDHPATHARRKTEGKRNTLTLAQASFEHASNELADAKEALIRAEAKFNEKRKRLAVAGNEFDSAAYEEIQITLKYMFGDSPVMVVVKC